MSNFFKTKRFQPPLHLAIINDDFGAIALLKNNPELLQRKNWLGFTTQELAELLGKEAAQEALLPKIHPPILVQTQEDKEDYYYNRLEFEALFGVHYIAGLSFASNELLEEVVAKCPWLLANTVVGEEHRSLGAKFRKQLFSGQMAPVAIKWIDDEIGYGLFAIEKIPKMSFCGQYAGVVRKIKRLRAELNGYCMHLPTRFWSFDYFVIDAQKASNEFRFANHSDAPNMRPFCLIDRGLVHIVFFAIEDIEPGQELTFNYGKDYWRKRTKKETLLVREASRKMPMAGLEPAPGYPE